MGKINWNLWKKANVGFYVIVGTGVLDCPSNTKNKMYNFVEVYTFHNMIFVQFFIMKS